MVDCESACSETAEKHGPSPQIEPQINWKQIMGCLSVTSISFAAGLSLSFTSALLPALQSPTSDIPTTPEQSAWLASSSWLCSPVGAILGGFLMEHFGRLTTIQISLVPFSLAWILIAIARNFTTILIARIITGVVFTIGTAPAGVLIAETALKNYRGTMTSVALTKNAFGTLCGFIMGAFLDWRTFAWIASLTGVIPLILACIFSIESPVWLRSRGRIEKAQKASLYYYGDPDYVVQPVIRQETKTDVDSEKPKPKQESTRPSFLTQFWMLLTSPSGLKPLIIVNVMLLLQYWTGIYIILVYAVIFFQEAGSTIDPYYATIMVGVIRVFACCITIYLISRFNRRTLMLVSTVAMALCMVASAYATNLALIERKGGPISPFPSWFAVTCVVTYNLAATIGLQTIPWTMTAEVFPRRVRGPAQTVTMILAEVSGFASLQAYPWMNLNMGGAVGVQYFFAAASILATGFVWIFCPETHGKSLSEIEDYFSKNTIYLGHKKDTNE